MQALFIILLGIQVGHFKDFLIVETPECSDVWATIDGNKYESKQLTKNLWKIEAKGDSGTISMVVCTDTGTCKLVEKEWSTKPRLKYLITGGICLIFIIFASYWIRK